MSNRAALRRAQRESRRPARPREPVPNDGVGLELVLDEAQGRCQGPDDRVAVATCDVCSTGHVFVERLEGVEWVGSFGSAGDVCGPCADDPILWVYNGGAITWHGDTGSDRGVSDL